VKENNSLGRRFMPFLEDNGLVPMGLWRKSKKFLELKKITNLKKSRPHKILNLKH
jgi:hypothetical protein